MSRLTLMKNTSPLLPQADLSVETAHQFSDAEQQRSAAGLGMWIFLATEILLFGALFLAYTVYRLAYPAAFEEAARHTMIVIGSVNTAVLLVSSFFVAVAVHTAEAGERLRTTLLLRAAALLGLLFLALKGVEYHHEIREGFFPGPSFRLPGAAPGAEMFFVLYFTMTGLHALHVAIGVALLSACGLRVLLARRPAALATTTDLIGLYWHFVDVVWIFLFPLFYLTGRAP